MLKISLPYKKFTTSWANNSRIDRIEKAKFPGYYFHINTNKVRFSNLH